MTPARGAEVVKLGRGHIKHLVKMHYFFESLLLYFGEWFRKKNKETVLILCLLNPIVLTGYIAYLSSVIVELYIFYVGAVIMLI